MKWFLLLFSIATCAVSVGFLTPWILVVSVVSLLVLGVEAYAENAKVKEVVKNIATAEAHITTITKAEASLSSRVKRLEDKVNDILSQDPTSRPARRRL